MTLITYVVTSEYVVLASDRRMTTFVGDVPKKFEDVALKTFLLNGQMLMGYTGVAVLDGKPMESWAADVLRGVLPNETPGALRDAMQEYFGRHPEVAGMPHHFRLAGFFYNPERNPTTWPVMYEIGNCTWEVVGKRMRASSPTSQFGFRGYELGNRKHAVSAVGYPYSVQSIRALEGKVRTALRANPLNASLVFGPVVDFMRRTAVNSGGMVGETILLTCLPRSAVPMEVASWSFSPTDAELASVASAQPIAMMMVEGTADPTIYLPAAIFPDRQVTGIKLSLGDDGHTGHFVMYARYDQLDGAEQAEE